MKKRSLAACAAFFLTTQAACSDWFDLDFGDVEEDVEDETSRPPELTFDIGAIDGVMGADSPLFITVRDDVDDVLNVDVTFAERRTYSVQNGVAYALTGADLSEGFGNLLLWAGDSHGGRATSGVEGLLVDLTPPRIELGTCTLSADPTAERGAFQLWVGDGWALGGVDVIVTTDSGDALVANDEFPEWPTTFLADWDWSFLAVPSDDLPAGASALTVRARDRAGNLSEQSCALFVDGTAPTVALTAQLEGADIVLSSTVTDDGPEGITRVRFLAAEVEVAAAPPGVGVTLDTADFPAGPLTLVAVAVDGAGNAGRSIPVTIEIPQG